MKAKRFTAIFFLGTIIFLMSLAFAGYATKKLNDFTQTRKEIQAVNIDWESLYPFEDGRHSTPDEPSLIERAFLKLKERCENYASKGLMGYYAFIETAKSYEEFIGWNMAAFNGYNPVIKLHDGYLSGLVSSRDISENAEAVKGLDEFCRDLGIEYAYINIPAKICTSDDKDISGILDFSNRNADRLLDKISSVGVKYYDLRNNLHNEGMNHHEAFFRTDHHWRPETGLWAAKHILQILRDGYGWNVDPEILNPDNFEHKVYSDWFLGSQGKKLTLARTKPDDFTLLYPKFRTLIRFEAPSLGIDTSGDFSVTYNIRQVEKRGYYGLNPYAAYKYADQPLTRIHNLLNHDGRKILFIHDSVSNSVIPFVALGIENTDEIDLRHFTGSVRSYIKITKPDLVITAYYATIPGRKEPNGKKFYDFR